MRRSCHNAFQIDKASNVGKRSPDFSISPDVRAIGEDLSCWLAEGRITGNLLVYRSCLSIMRGGFPPRNACVPK